VNATSGAFLYTLDTSTIAHQGTSEVSGQNAIDLVAAAVADDGAVYISSASPNASGGQLGDTTKMFRLYMWSNSSPTTVPVTVFQGDPSSTPPGLNYRWGDVMAARGSGTNTELILDSNDGQYGAVLRPMDATMTQFTNSYFFASGGGGSIGRSIQHGTNNTFYQKRKGASLILSSYNVTNQTSLSTSVTDFTATLGGVAVDTTRNLAIGVDFVGSTTAPLKPDAVALYDISVAGSPLLIARYNFPSNQVGNANFICQTVVTGNRVYSLDANNGLMAFTILPPQQNMALGVALAGGNAVLSWGTNVTGATLQTTPAIAPTSWIDVTNTPVVVGTNYNVTLGATNATSFFRLKK
jgi:hypothetical protein